MPNEKTQPSESDLKKREAQQGLKKDEKPGRVEERPADRAKDDEIGKKNGSPTPLPDDKAVESGARRVPGDPPDCEEED